MKKHIIFTAAMLIIALFFFMLIYHTETLGFALGVLTLGGFIGLLVYLIYVVVYKIL